MAMFNPEYFCVKEEIVPLLEAYQLERINNLVADFIKSNSESDIHQIEYCPKCNCEHPRLIRAGKAGSGKRLLMCSECRGRFVYDTGSLTYYSHQSASKWAQFIEMTIEKSSLNKCAEELNVHKSTAFRMRQKLMAFLKMVQAGDSLSGLCEVDETFIHADCKDLYLKRLVRNTTSCSVSLLCITRSAVFADRLPPANAQIRSICLMLTLRYWSKKAGKRRREPGEEVFQKILFASSPALNDRETAYTVHLISGNPIRMR